jgi:hypothetical protein
MRAGAHKLASRTDDEGAEAVHMRPLASVEQLEKRDEEGQGLAAACSRCAQYVAA